MTQALGQMANAPLALVLAQVRFSPYLSIEKNIPAIQDAMRKPYPAFRKGQMQTIEIAPGVATPSISMSERWDFADADNHECFIVQQSSLVFLATRYKTYGDFASRHSVVLQCFERTVPDVFVEGLGLRYVDLIVPRENERPEQYVIEGLRGCAFDTDSQAFQSRYIARWKMNDGLITFRYVSGARPPFLPPDLQPVELQVPEVIKRASHSKAQIGMMDFDRTLDYRGQFRGSNISNLFSRMHDDASKLFRRAMSTHAEAAWNSKTA